MKLRTRMAAAAGVAVAITVVVLAVAQYEAARSTLRGQIDQSLRERANPILQPRPGDGQARPEGRDAITRAASARASLLTVAVDSTRGVPAGGRA